MDKLPAWVAKVGLFWVMIGTFIINLGQTGTEVPAFLSLLFSQDTWNGLVTAFGAVLDAAAIFKVIIASLKKEDATVSILSLNVKMKHINPLHFG